MPRYQLLPDAKLGLDIGGRTIRPDRRGRVHVSDEDAARIRGSSAYHRYDALVEIAPYRRLDDAGDGWVCDDGWAAWPWSTTCARCGAPVPEGASLT